MPRPSRPDRRNLSPGTGGYWLARGRRGVFAFAWHRSSGRAPSWIGLPDVGQADCGHQLIDARPGSLTRVAAFVSDEHSCAREVTNAEMTPGQGSAEAILLQAARALLGWLGDEQAFRLLASGQDNPTPLPEWRSAIDAARAAVAARGDLPDSSGVLDEAPPELEEHEECCVPRGRRLRRRLEPTHGRSDPAVRHATCRLHRLRKPTGVVHRR